MSHSLLRKIRALCWQLKELGKANLVLIILSTVGLIGAVYAMVYFWPSKTTVSYDSKSCISRTTILPKLHKISSGDDSHAYFEDIKSIGSYPLVSRSVCLDFKQAPKENTTLTVVVKPFRNPVVSQTSRFYTGHFPKLSAKTSKFPEIISTKDPLYFDLDKADSLFSYQLATQDQAIDCDNESTMIKCDISSLGLSHSKEYKLKIIRKFVGTHLDTLLDHSVQTVSPVNITQSSIQPNGMVYDSPTSITLTFDKQLLSHEKLILKKADGSNIEFASEQKANQLVLTLKNPLPRNTSFSLSLADVKATDRGYLSKPFALSFSTSGGPKVLGRNIGSYDVAANATIRLTFDVALKPEVAAQHIQLIGASGPIESRVSVAGNTVTISPARSFGRCEAFSVKVLDGLQNIYGISGGIAHQYSSRSTCRSVFSIGASAEGRAITAYKFGSGPSTILYVGATHGNEVSSKYTLDSWVNYLESVAPSIPAQRTVVVIPNVNPDGFARASRTNARGVDLNRNFPANSWKADVTIPGGQLVVNGGGTSPLSEPESAALASYTQAVRPRLVLTYHAKGSLVTANEAGDSMAIANIYGGKAGYRAIAESQLGSTFNYDTTGAYENWLLDKVGIPALLVELPTHTDNLFSKNKNAMWAMLSL